MRAVLGFIVGLVVRLWLATLRVRVVRACGEPLGSPAPAVFAFCHGQQMLLLAARRALPPGSVVLVSRSADGELQSGVLGALGFDVVRGSSSRGGSSGLKALIRRLRRGRSAVVAVDGPRGPAGVAKPGAGRAAAMAGLPVVPVAGVGSRVVRLRRTWDRFQIPLPGSRVLVVADDPGSVASRGTGRAAALGLSADLARLEATARGLLASERDPWHSALPEDGPCPRR